MLHFTLLFQWDVTPVASLFGDDMTYYIKRTSEDLCEYQPEDSDPQDKEGFVSDGRNLWQLESTTLNDGNTSEK